MKILLIVIAILICSSSLNIGHDAYANALNLDRIIHSRRIELPLKDMVQFIPHELNSLEVIATAYNNVPGQTNEDPDHGAWNHKMKKGYLAVSRDLLEKYSLEPLTKIYVECLDCPEEFDHISGIYQLADKMHKRYEERIDLFFGKDIKLARKFGRRKAKILWKQTLN